MLRTLLALLLLAIPLAAEAQTFPQRGREPVVDAAGLLDAGQKAQITALSEEINKATTRQFVVATIPDLQGYEIEDYGNRLLLQWGLGQKDADNGIILIVVMAFLPGGLVELWARVRGLVTGRAVRGTAAVVVEDR